MVTWRVHAWIGGHLPPPCFFLIGNNEGDSKKRISFFLYFIFVLLIFFILLLITPKMKSWTMLASNIFFLHNNVSMNVREVKIIFFYICHCWSYRITSDFFFIFSWDLSRALKCIKISHDLPSFHLINIYIIDIYLLLIHM
jgi:hypothetical protein